MRSETGRRLRVALMVTVVLFGGAGCGEGAGSEAGLEGVTIERSRVYPSPAGGRGGPSPRGRVAPGEGGRECTLRHPAPLRGDPYPPFGPLRRTDLLPPAGEGNTLVSPVTPTPSEADAQRDGAPDSPQRTTPAAVYTVTSTANSGAGTLRDAIIQSQAGPAGSTIAFNIAGGGDKTITLSSQLDITNGQIIDGCTQPESNCTAWPPTLKVILRCSSKTNGIALAPGTTASTIRGLVVQNCYAGAFVGKGAHRIQTSFFGTNSAGTTASANQHGIYVNAADAALIGSDLDGANDAIERNLISGNDVGIYHTESSAGVRINGNYIGTNAAGTAALKNRIGLYDYGGLGSRFERNLISGNDEGLVCQTGSGSTIVGNQIGTNAAGTAGIPNTAWGVKGDRVNKMVVGGTGANDANVVAYNKKGFYIIDATTIARLTRNSVFLNQDDGIDTGAGTNDEGDADTGANNLQNSPEISAVTYSSGQLTVTYRVASTTSASSYPLTIEFFMPDDDGEEGMTFVGSDTYSSSDASKPRTVTFTPAVSYDGSDWLSATATDSAGRTSEFTVLDVDGDGYNVATDCNDNSSAIYPGAIEKTGDGVDQNCDGMETCYKDADDDGYRPDSSATVTSSDTDCTDPGEAISSDPTGDCNDASATVYSGATEVVGDNVDESCDNKETCYKDADNDGYRPDGTSTVSSADADCNDTNEAVSTDPTGDCKDTDAAVNPGATEKVGDAVDQDCDGKESCYKDADNDGYRPDSSATVTSSDTDCSDSGEAVSGDPIGDCDDANASVKPGATEITGDGVDQNCDGKETCYKDADNDGYRPNTSATVSSTDGDCSDPGEAVSSDPTTDCDDNAAIVYPGATEVPGDEIDEDCDGKETCYKDTDNDGYRPSDVATVASSDKDCQDTGEAVSGDPSGDCNDADPSINPGAADQCDGVDRNCDGEISQDNLDDDEDGARICEGDCDDADPSTYPGAIEGVADGKDQDCDGGELCYADGDQDGYRTDATVASADLVCTAPGEAGSSRPSGDCNDDDDAVHPGAAEVAGNGVDEDCDGQELCYVDADDDGYRPESGATASSATLACTGTGLADASSQPGDCADTNPAIHPGATELAGDEVDQNCDGLETCYKDADDDGYRPDGMAAVASGDTDCADPGEAISSDATGDCDDTDASIFPGATEETGDEVDSDCDGKETCYVDADGDGYRPDDGAETTVSSDSSCAGAGEAAAGAPTGDCADADGSVHPGAEELCDGVDRDCDGALDAGNEDGDGDGVLGCAGDCDDADPALHPGATEVAGDEIDQDCDGTELCYADSDGDGYRTSSTVSSVDLSCGAAGEAPATTTGGDCDDNAADVNPGAEEDPGDGLDQDCDGRELCYADADGDGYRPDDGGTVEGDSLDCDAAGEATEDATAGDCDDDAAAVYPGAVEVAGDGVDQDCDGGELCAIDADADGFRADGTSTTASSDLDCEDPGEAASDAPVDCDDADETVHAPSIWYRDSDADAFGDAASPTESCSAEPPAGYVGNDDDNCPAVKNADQADYDGDGLGDACDDQPASGLEVEGNGLACSMVPPAAPGGGGLYRGGAGAASIVAGITTAPGGRAPGLVGLLLLSGGMLAAIGARRRSRASQ